MRPRQSRIPVRGAGYPSGLPRQNRGPVGVSPGIHLVGTSEGATTTVWDHDFTGPTALVVGNETTGMSSFWASACETVVQIPMTGSASSFNASIAASIARYEVTRQRSSAPGLAGADYRRPSSYLGL